MPLFFKHQRAKPHMPWGAAVGSVVGAVANKALASDGGGGGSSQQSSSEPWAMAQPWMMSNIVNGMNQQNELTAHPFSAQQQQAYDNSYALNDYMRTLVPGLLGQIGGQQVGFDRSNPNARPDAWNWSGLLSENAPDLGQRSVLNARPAAEPTAARNDTGGDFMQQEDMASGANMGSPYSGSGNLMGTGGYGSFKYGMPAPKAGTQEYRDMSSYFANGGYDPNDYYGKKAETAGRANAAHTDQSSLWNPNAGAWYAPGQPFQNAGGA